MFLLFFSFLESCGTNSIFVNYYLAPIMVIPFHLSTASTYTRLYRFVRYRLSNQLLGIKHNNYCPNRFRLLYRLFKIKRKRVRPTNSSHSAWLRCYHCIPRRRKVPSTTTTTTTKSPYNTCYSCCHQSSNYSQDYMFNIELLEYFSSIYHHFLSTKPKPNRTPRNTSGSSGTRTTYTPSSNPKHPNSITTTKRSVIVSTTTIINKEFHH